MTLRERTRRCVLAAEQLEDRLTPAAPFPEFVDPNPAPGNRFGDTVLLLSSNVLITSPGDDANGTDTGAVYLFNGATGALISSLRGSTTGDFESASVQSFGGSSAGVVLVTPKWDDGAVENAGAVTFINQTTGLSGVISAANSLVGTSKDDGVSMSMTELRNGNFLVSAPNWDNGSVENAGAVTFIQGTAFTGVISAANSLVGTSKDDRVGFDVRRIDAGSGVGSAPRGDYLVVTPGWDDGATLVDVGAVTFANGTTGITGVVSAANSLVGSSKNDRVGQSVRTGDSLSKVYVVTSSSWDNGSVADVGAVTFASNETGITGVVSAANSQVGSTASDGTGMTAFSLNGGNYVVARPSWDNGAAVNVGAATFVNTTTGLGVAGVVSAANSLVGSTTGDLSGMRADDVGESGYVIQAPNWDNGSVEDAGAVMYSSIATPITGVISAANSLVGTSKNDRVGQNVFYDSSSRFFGNPGYAVITAGWDNGSVVDVGAVTFVNPTTGVGVTGVVTAANSFIGSTAGDGNGLDVDFGNGSSAAIASPRWDNGSVMDAGAVTFVTAATGLTGVFGAANSLVGSTAGDGIGLSVSVPTVGFDFIIQAPNWDNGSVVDAGAVTFVVNDTVAGVISAANSLVGSTTDDLQSVSINRFVGANATVVISRSWDNGTVADVGAATFVPHATGITGVISAANSLVGSTAGDGDEMSASEIVSGDVYVVISPRWDNGSVADAGAVTYGSDVTGITGVISAANSLVGSTAGDGIGMFVDTMPKGNYTVGSPGWDNGSVVDAGAVTYVTAGVGPVGPITTQNSMFGSSPNTGLKSVERDFTNGTYYARFLTDGGGRVRLGDEVSVPPVVPPPPSNGTPPLAVGGANGSVAVFAASGGQYAAAATLTPFAGFTGGVRTATADVDGDGIADTVAVTGPGTPIRVAVVSGADNSTVLVAPFDPFGGDFTGGGFVAAADLDGDGKAEFVVTPDQGGGPRVSIFSLANGSQSLRANFFGIDDPDFRGGARSAVGDVNADGTPDLAVSAGFLGGPRTALFDGTTLLGTPTRLIADFFAFPGTDAETLRNGVFVTSGDVDGDGKAELIFGGGPGGAPRVFILGGALVSGGDVAGAQAAPVANFFVAGNADDRGGVRLAVKNADGDNKADVVAGSGEGSPSKVRIYLGANFSGGGEPATFQDLDPFAATLPGGVFVG